MKMNWGWKIAMAYTLFALMVLGVVFFSFTKKVNLVEKNYYEQEINYQEQIDKIKNTKEFGGGFAMAFDKGREMVAITSQGQNVSGGNVHFYRPSDSEKDVRMALDLDVNGRQFIDVGSFEKGLWVAKVDWTADGRSFYKSLQIEL